LGARPDMSIMQEEIFGPLLPLVGYKEAGEPVSYINKHDRPLALYWFGKDNVARDEVLSRTISGGVTVNDCLFHFTSEDNADFGGEYHGKGGPLAVNKLRTDNPVQQTFLQAAREAQFRIREDFNAEGHEGLGVYQVTQRNGERWSAARAYVHPHMATRANLRVETHAQATRILFEGKRAVGVEYRQGEATRQIRARREVILSSGAFQTPQLLLLSGVGDSAALASHGIATT